MQNPQIEFEIKMNAGPQKGETVRIETNIEELEESTLSVMLIERDILWNWCNKDEYTVIGRRLISQAIETPDSAPLPDTINTGKKTLTLHRYSFHSDDEDTALTFAIEYRDATGEPKIFAYSHHPELAEQNIRTKIKALNPASHE